MRKVALFGEDYAHELVIGALVERIAAECNISIRPDWRNAVGGHGEVVAQLRSYLRDLRHQSGPWPDLIIAATDANCKGLNERRKEMDIAGAPAPTLLAVPDPHIERWLLLDGSAFKTVFGKGCEAPDQKCDRDRYKGLLIEAILATGHLPNLGGIEYAKDIVLQMDIHRAAGLDKSFRRFVEDLFTMFRKW